VVGTDQGTFYIDDIFKSGAITSAETWGPGDIIVHGDVTVNANVKLTISAGTNVYFVYDFDTEGGGTDDNKVELIVYGEIDAQGDSEDLITFTSSRPDNKAAGDWRGIHLKNGSTATFDYCEMLYAYTAVKADTVDSIAVTNSSIKYHEYTGIGLISPPATAIIENCIFDSCGDYSIGCFEGDPHFSYSTISNSEYGIYYYGDGHPWIEADSISHPAEITNYWGIYITSGDPNDNPDPIIYNCIVKFFSTGGIYVKNAVNNGSIGYTKVDSCGTYGIWLDNSDVNMVGASIAPNSIVFCGGGLYLTNNSDPVVHWSRIKNNEAGGVWARSGSVPDLGDDKNGYNSIGFIDESIPGGYFDVKNDGQTTIMAESNYWGTEGAYIYGPVDYDPDLDTDPLPGFERGRAPSEQLPTSFIAARN
jgi:hypothetical protein